MKSRSKLAVGILASVGVMAIAASMLGPILIDCTTQRISRVASPSGERIAEHYQTRCKSAAEERTEIHLVHGGTRVRTDIGAATADRIRLAWGDERSLLISVPPGLEEKAFDRPMQGVQLRFQVVDTIARPARDATPGSRL